MCGGPARTMALLVAQGVAASIAYRCQASTVLVSCAAPAAAAASAERSGPRAEELGSEIIPPALYCILICFHVATRNATGNLAATTSQLPPTVGCQQQEMARG
ncbi:hypothetical protein GGI43DRAFT_192286 [Trichoderma evansii]